MSVNIHFRCKHGCCTGIHVAKDDGGDLLRIIPCLKDNLKKYDDGYTDLGYEKSFDTFSDDDSDSDASGYYEKMIKKDLVSCGCIRYGTDCCYCSKRFKPGDAIPGREGFIMGLYGKTVAINKKSGIKTLKVLEKISAGEKKA